MLPFVRTIPVSFVCRRSVASVGGSVRICYFVLLCVVPENIRIASLPLYCISNSSSRSEQKSNLIDLMFDR